MTTLASRIRAEDVVAEPFPHLVVRDVLDEETCSRLIAEFPPIDVVSQGRPAGSNMRYSLRAPDALEEPRMPEVWRQLIREHVSQEFLDDLMRLFGDHIHRLYPDFERDHGPIDGARVGVRRSDGYGDGQLHLDAQISVNTPVVERPNSVRDLHVDARNKLIVGLFYLRADDDDSHGGDLELARWRSEPRGLAGPLACRRFARVVQTVPYARNTLVLFVNSPYSLHGVTVRERTSSPRLFLNIVGEVEGQLFDWTPYQASSWDKLLASPDIVRRKLAARS